MLSLGYSRGRARSRVGFLALLLCLELWGAPASAQTAEEEARGRAHFRLGRAHYDNGDFLKAAHEFEEAYRSSKRATLQYNVYLAYRDANRQAEAAEALRKYLAEADDVENRPQLEAKLRALDAALARSAQAEPAQEPVAEPVAQPTAQPPATSPPASQPASEPGPAPAPVAHQDDVVAAVETDTAIDSGAPAAAGSKNLLPLILMGGGGAMVVASLVTGLMAISDQGKLEDECPTRLCTDPSLKDTESRGETLALVTDVLLFGGLAVAGTGAALYFLGRGHAAEDSTGVAFGCSTGGCYGSVRGRY